MERPNRRQNCDTGDTAIASNLRCNERIRISPIRLIDENNEQVGVVDVKDAQQRAVEAGLDLVEVAPKASPPVCRIMDYGKWKYAQAKKDRKSKASRHETELKGVRIKTPKIGAHDLMIKVNRARKFLERGDRVQFSLRFRGRELAHIEEGQRIFNEIKETLSDVSKVDQNYRREGRRITMTLGPLPKGSESPAAKKSPPPPQAAAARPRAAAVPPPATAAPPQPTSAPPAPAAPEPAAATPPPTTPTA